MNLVRLSIMILFSISLLLTACSSQEQKESLTSNEKQQTNDVSDMNWHVPSFQAVDQNGQSFGLPQMKGKVWLADFIFTRCPNICPPMTANMSRVQKELKNQKLDVSIVSFSADPVYDQPEILKKFATKYSADLSNWSFLTGYSLTDVQKIVQTAFKGTITQQPGPSKEMPLLVNHPSQFYLIDGQGKVRKFYDGLRPNPKQIAQDIQELTQ
ncbi:protein SCO1/2 [Seinonella peptonophila]|uniref:Protein SCO1/2 n=1 Tax=Seinonella peptonophila TaxID=112248 RepID=A0A1M4TU77_9BACL|nr:SCO family protein [Seinonella peptonophila]SHE47966.1 protein SCO1/2 [Seinonella peptonophila]